MREILFKAKRIDNREWIIGSLIKTKKDYYICEKPYECMDEYSSLNGQSYGFGGFKFVDPSTICQYTGLTDKNSQKIWENDIVETIYNGKQNPNYVVIWDKDDLGFLATNGKEHYGTNSEYLGCCEEIIVIGNIFDNPELLNE